MPIWPVIETDAGFVGRSSSVFVISSTNYPCGFVGKYRRINASLLPQKHKLEGDIRKQFDTIDPTLRRAPSVWQLWLHTGNIDDNLGRYSDIKSWGFSTIDELKLEWPVGRISYKSHAQPWPLIINHDLCLSLHNSPLFRGILISEPNSSDSDSGSHPKSRDLPPVSAALVLILGGFLIFCAFKLLSYGFQRGDYFYGIALFGGFIPLTLGIVLILCCLLPSPPSIFGFSVQHISLPFLE